MVNGETEKKMNCFGNFVMKQYTGGIKVFSGELIALSETHFTIRMRDGRECSLLRNDCTKIEWVKA
jgi:hypothetical protein